MCTSLQKTKCKETLLECWNTNACFQSGWPGILNKDKHGGSTLFYWQRNLYSQISTEQLPDCIELCLPVSKSWATLWWLRSYAYQYMPNSWFHHIPILDVNFSNSNIPWLAPKRCPRPPPPRRRWPWFSLPWPPLREQEQNRSFWVNYTPSFIRVW